jgi:hypothetical protein
MFDRLISAVIALCLAFLVWLYARSRDQETLDNVPIPVQMALAPGQADQYDLEVTGPSQVLASFMGPPSRMRELRDWLQQGTLKVQATLTVPEDRLGETHYLDTVRIDAADIHPPPGVRPLILEGRNRIPVTLRKLAERRLPVRLNHNLADRVGKVQVEPDTVLVRGPQEILDRAQGISTRLYCPPIRSDTPPLQEVESVGRAHLVQVLEGRPIRCLPETVAVRLTLQPRQHLYEMTEVPVEFLVPAKFGLQPQWEIDRDRKISLRVVGPASEEPPRVVAYIDLTDGKFEAALYADEPLKLQLPKDFQLAQDPPRSGTFRLVPIPNLEPPRPPGLSGVPPP